MIEESSILLRQRFIFYIPPSIISLLEESVIHLSEWSQLYLKKNLIEFQHFSVNIKICSETYKNKINFINKKLLTLTLTYLFNK